MNRLRFVLLGFALIGGAAVVNACCPAGARDKPVVNADQTVVILWDPQTKMQHFIRKASFKSDGDDFGFLIPSPTQPELNESGDAAFGLLQKLTEPEVRVMPRGKTKKVGEAKSEPPKSFVKVLEQKVVAGFNAAVLETNSTKALVKWLDDNGYVFSPQVEAWAKPYVEHGWKITALKIATGKDGKADRNVSAAALRMSFKTDRPLFPYREPDSAGAAESLGARSRLLRIYFISDGRYAGELTKTTPWTGTTAWSGKVSAADRAKVLELLKLPATTGPAEWWMTEFEDPWPYRVAPADLTFARAEKQEEVRRRHIYVESHRTLPETPWYESGGSATAVLFGLVAVAPVAAWRRRRTKS